MPVAKHPRPLKQDGKVLEVKKHTFNEFLAIESLVYTSQLLIFYLVALFSSNLFRDENLVISFLKSKASTSYLLEMFLTIISTFTVIGILYSATKIITHPKATAILDSVLCEVPRIIYTIGSSVTAAILSGTTYLHIHSKEEPFPLVSSIFIGLLFFLVMFIYGFSFSYAFNREKVQKSRIKKPPKSIKK
ncbi:hypothetical protein [Cellvibrio mixtus]|uniref:hypothetical protein n=1 Tax=Cellvibrio mixtus TaxID=39650 RepID=UPI000586C373|nr:hypothetical protein [Cellvibrio mixtus]